MSQERHESPELAGPPGRAVPEPNLNHELRTFLHSIIGYIELVQEDAAAQGRDNLSEGLDKIWMASNYLAALVEENLPETQAPTGSIGLEPTSLSRESAGQWLREQIVAPDQRQRD